MNTQNELSSSSTTGMSGKSLAALSCAGIVVAGAFAWQANRTSELARQVNESQQQKATLQAKLEQADTAWQSAMRSVRDELDESREANKDLVSASDRQAQRRAGQFAKQNQQLSEELAHVKSMNDEASAKLASISTDVGAVKDDVGAVKTDVGGVHSDVEATRTDLKDARAELLRVKGDLGEMSGLIATNSKQIQFLRDLGDRNIYEFTLSRDAMQKVGDIQLTLKKADMKHNRYTVNLLADDRHVEKKDRSINEPVQFYTAKAKQPYELVINSVQKDKVVGYLATPKVTVSRLDESR